MVTWGVLITTWESMRKHVGLIERLWSFLPKVPGLIPWLYTCFLVILIFDLNDRMEKRRILI